VRVGGLADTILIEVYTDDFGSEMVTTASTELIQNARPSPSPVPPPGHHPNNKEDGDISNRAPHDLPSGSN
jgi:hypothetical protein